jgi:hypothetical protein
MIDYVRQRTGEGLYTTLNSPKKFQNRQFLQGIFAKLQRIWIRAGIKTLPAAFVEQNVSLAGIGERHHWLWDFHQLRSTLETVGFENCERWSHNTSGISGFPFYPLDINDDGLPRKGVESMYVEAQKPMKQINGQM